MIREMIALDSSAEFERKVKEFKSKMAEAFFQYFEDNIENDLRNHVAHFSVKKFPAFRYSKPTTNLAEGFNTMVKSYLESTPKRPDVVLLRLLELQIEKLDEFNRALKGYGDFKVSTRYK